MSPFEEGMCTSPRLGQAQGIAAIVDFARLVNPDRRRHRTIRLVQGRLRDRLDVKGQPTDDGGRFVTLH